jgi:hypothetical protein
MLQPEEAGDYFALSENQVNQLPRFRVVPEFYNPEYFGLWSREDDTLVSVLAARELGVKVHGSVDSLLMAREDRLREYGLFDNTDNLNLKYLAVGKSLLREPLPPYDDDCIKDIYNEEPDEWFGMAAMEFPSLSKTGELDEGIWCKGCQPTTEPDLIDPPVNAKSRPWDRAWSTVSFLEHVKRCPGARELLAESAKENTSLTV